jgi:Family of unknown function (DUF6090)
MGNVLRSGWMSYAVRETAIVTIGILIAFMLNAWWEGQKQAREESRHLRALASDFTQNAEQLTRLIELERAILSASLALIQPNNTLDGTGLRDAIGRVFSSDRFEPVMGAYEGLVSSAGLTLISDDELRVDLASFAAAVRNPYGEKISSDFYFAFTREFIGKLQMVENVLRQPTSSERYRELLSDVRFREHLALRYAAERDVERYYRGLLETCNRINARLKRNDETE